MRECLPCDRPGRDWQMPVFVRYPGGMAIMLKTADRTRKRKMLRKINLPYENLRKRSLKKRQCKVL
jgi:hypothetical protein